jgi:hypothetical protein
MGAKVGIAVAAVLFLLGTTGFCIVWNGKRRRRNTLRRRQRESGLAEWANHPSNSALGRKDNNNNESQFVGPSKGGNGDTSAGGFFDSPQSQKPLNTSWNRTTGGLGEDLSPEGEKAYFSPYSSHYSSPVSAHDQILAVGREWPVERKGSVGFGGGITEQMDNVGERIEMVDVKGGGKAPVLGHPGLGRGMGRGGLTEDDVRRGDAL